MADYSSSSERSALEMDEDEQLDFDPKTEVAPLNGTQYLLKGDFHCL